MFDLSSDDDVKVLSVNKRAVSKKRKERHDECTIINLSMLSPPTGQKLNLKGSVEMTQCIGSQTKFNLKSLIQEELLEALVSSYHYDDAFLESLFPISVKITKCVHRPDTSESTPIQITSPTRSSVFPPIGGRGCMHIKFIIMFYPTFLRLVIPSANLVQFDYDMIENIVYHQDFLVRPVETKFGLDLQNLLTNMNIPVGLVERVLKYDYSSAMGSLIISKPGTYATENYGMRGLQKAVQKLNLPKTPKSTSFYQSSSVGNLNQKWVDTFTACSEGLDFNQRPTATPHFIFPTRNYVENESAYGPNGAGTMFCQERFWNNPNFPRALFYECRSLSVGVRDGMGGGALMHSKIIIHTTKPVQQTCSFVSISSNEKDGYLLLGSHNQTAAAFGSISAKKLNLTISNWELSILIPINSQGKRFQIPFQVLPDPYGDKKPWIQTLN